MRCFEHQTWPIRAVRQYRNALAAAALVAFTAQAQDLGVIGPVYPIAEPSLLDVILAKLRDAEATGALARLFKADQTASFSDGPTGTPS